MSQSAKASKPRRSRRRWLWLAPLLVLGVPVLLVVLLIGFLETSLGKRTLAGLIEDLASSPGQQLSIGTLEGSLFSSLRIKLVSISAQRSLRREKDVRLFIYGVIHRALNRFDIRLYI